MKKSFRPQAELMETRALLSSGALDASFGGSGIIGGPSGTADAVLVQPADGKIVAAGDAPGSSGYSQFALVRDNPDGTPDTSFGAGGEVITNLASNGSIIHGAVLQADGKIVAVGEAFVKASKGPYATVKDEWAVVRYTPSGALDTTFGGTKNKNGTVSNAGEAFLSFGSGKDVPQAVALETVNGATKIVVAGWTNSVTGHPEIALARYNADGVLDTTFGNKGTVVTAIPNTSVYGAFAYAVAVQPDGKIVVAGDTNSVVAGPTPAFLARYDVNGTLDATFGNQGLVLAQFTSQDVFNSVAIQPDGKIVVAGGGSVVVGDGVLGFGEVARFNADGTLDTTFAGGSGVFEYPQSGSEYYAVALQSNGQIVAAGAAPNYEGLVTRLNVDGSLDTAYGSGGSATTAAGVVLQYNAVVIQPSDGSAVVAGFMSPGWPAQEYVVARYTA